MGFLGFRRQAWKNPDAEVRLRAIPDMAADLQGTFRDLALTDDDPRVRAAAARRVTAGEALQLLTTRGDDAVRRIAREKLAGVAEMLVRTKPLGECRTLLDGISDQKSLAELSLHAQDEAVRAVAWERLRASPNPSQALFTTVAIQDAHGQRGRQAVALLERKALKDVARKAKHADVRAAAEAVLATAVPEETKPSVERQRQTRRRAIDEILAAATRLGVAADAVAVAPQWTDLDARWTAALALAPDADPGDIASQQERFARLKRESAARAEAERERRAAARAARRALLDELAALVPAPAVQAAALAARAPWRARWAALPALGADDAAAAEREFAQNLERALPVATVDPAAAATAAAVAEPALVLPAEQLAALEILASEAAALAASDDHQLAVHGFQLLHKRWLTIAADLPFDHPLRQAFPRAYADFKQRRQDERQHRQTAYQEALLGFKALVAEAEALAAEVTSPPAETLAQNPAETATATGSPAAAPPEPAAAAPSESAAAAPSEPVAAAPLDPVAGTPPPPAALAQDTQGSAAARPAGEAPAAARPTGKSGRSPVPVAEALKDIQRRARAFGQLRRSDAGPLRARLQRALDTAWEPLRREREAEDWERFANLARAEELIAAVEAAAALEDFPALANLVKRAHQDWKKLGPLPRDRQQPAWQRFKTACDAQFDRCRPFFAAQDAARAAAFERKKALLAEAESLAARPAVGLAGSVADLAARRDSAARFKAMQAEWRDIGPAPRDVDQDLWNRFRAACDSFFRLQQADSALRNQEMTANLDKKQALCAEVEAFAENAAAARAWREENASAIAAAASATAENPKKPTRPPKAPPGLPEPADVAAQAKEYQARWKELGHVPRDQVEAIWTRFRTACDKVWDSIEDHRKAQAAERAANLERKRALIKEVEDILGRENPHWFKDDVREMQDQWRAIGYVPRESMDAINRDFHELCAKVLAL